MVPRAGLGGFEKSKNDGFFRARSTPLTFVLKGQTKSNCCRTRSAPLTFVLKSQKTWIFPRAKRAVYVKLVEKNVFRESILDCRVTKR